jgi:hypothetical protein
LDESGQVARCQFRQLLPNGQISRFDLMSEMA